MSKRIIDEFTDLPLTNNQKCYRRKQKALGKTVNSDWRHNKIIDEFTGKGKGSWLYDKRHPGKAKSQKKKYYSKNPLQRMLENARRRANSQNCICDISTEDLVVPELCPILKIPLAFAEGRFTDNSPSLDKINPSLGYIKGNIRIISYKANRYKSDMSREILQALTDYIDGKI